LPRHTTTSKGHHGDAVNDTIPDGMPVGSNRVNAFHQEPEGRNGGGDNYVTDRRLAIGVIGSSHCRDRTSPESRQPPRLQHPSQGPFSQQQHPQSSQVHTPVTQQPQQSQSGQGVFSPARAGVRARAAQRRNVVMVISLHNGM